MLFEAHDQLQEYGFEKRKVFRDDDGPVAIALATENDYFILVAKEYAFNGLASFMKDVVEYAAPKEIKLLFWDNRAEDFTVFDSQTVVSEGDPSTGMSKKAHTDWIEIPKHKGTELPRFMDGKQLESPSQPGISQYA